MSKRKSICLLSLAIVLIIVILGALKLSGHLKSESWQNLPLTKEAESTLESLQAETRYRDPLTTWLAPRADGLEGSGTQDDPYDVSTPEKLHRRWARAKRTIRLYPGAYYSTGQLSCISKRIIGDDSVLYYVGANQPTGRAWLLRPDLIENVTLDCGTFTTGTNSAGIQLYLYSGTARNVTVTNLQGNKVTDLETFGIMLSGTNSTVEDCLVTWCKSIPHPYASAIICSQGKGHIIRNNIIELDRHNSPTNYTHGITAYADRCLITGNIVRNVQSAIYHDSAGTTPPDGGFDDNVYANNVLQANMRTISFDSGMKQAYRDLKFSNTTIISEHEGPHFAFDEQDWFCDTFIYLTTRKTNGIVGITFDGTTFIGGHKDVGGFNITIQPDTNLVSGIKFINSDWRDAGSFYSENYSGFDSIQSKDSVLSIIGPTFTNTIGIQSK